MPVPTHRAGCQTYIFETKCPDCHQRVYFFGCTCESKVFFDKKGPPWPLHRDRCIPYLIRTLQSETGLSDRAILERISEFASTRGLKVPKEIRTKLSDGIYPPRHKLDVINVRPYEGSAVIEGEIIEINAPINMNKKFNISNNAFGEGILGELARGEWSEISVRQMHTEFELFAYRFTFFAIRELVHSLSWRMGSRIAAKIKYLQIAGRDSVWVLEEAE